MTQWQTEKVTVIIGECFVSIERQATNGKHIVTTWKFDGEQCVHRWHDEFTEDTLEKAQKHAERLWEALSR